MQVAAISLATSLLVYKFAVDPRHPHHHPSLHAGTAAAAAAAAGPSSGGGKEAGPGRKGRWVGDVSFYR